MSTLYVTDFKYGYVPVEVEGNTQLLTYAAAALDASSLVTPDWVVLTIVQPRAFDTPQTWTITGQELVDWVERTLIPGAARTRDVDAPLRAGEKQCQWCLGKGNCPALADYALAPLDRDLVSLPQELVPPAPAKMAALHLVDVVTKSKLIKSWLDAVDAEVTRRLLENVPVLDWKLVRGKRGNKTWVGEEETVASVLRNNYKLADETIFSHELLSPAKMLTLPAVKESPDLLKPFITQKDGALCAAPATDKRPAVLTQDQLAAHFPVTTE